MYNSGRQNRVILIAGKEWYRFFTDLRMVVTALIFPGMLLYVVYSFFAPAMSKLVFGNGDIASVYAVNLPPSLKAILSNTEFTIQEIPVEEKAAVLEKISNKSGGFLLVFPEHFETLIASYDVHSGNKAPDIEMYYNSTADGFTVTYSKVTAVLNLYESAFSNKFDLNREIRGDLSKGETIANVFAMVLPMLILMFMFQGAMATTIESITGEKEHGTLATILVTPVSTWELSAGKILGLGAESFLCGFSGTLGTLLAMPRFFDSFSEGMDLPVASIFSLSNYSISDYVILFFVILSTTYFIVTLIALIAIWSKTTKEAQMLCAPMIIILMLICLTSTFYGSELQQNIFSFIIPIYNSAQSLSCIFGHDYAVTNIIITIGANIIFTLINASLLSYVFKNEKIMFSKCGNS